MLIAGSPRARYLEVLARCRLALGATAEARRTAAAARRLGLGRAPADGSRLGRPGGGGRRAARPATRPAQPSGRSRRPRPPTRPARRSRPRCRARSPASRSAARATATARRPSCSTPPASSRRAARSATATRPSASCESSATASTAARVRAADGTGLESLTERELQLARLVDQRQDQPADRAELFLSQKTVETHLRNIFRKSESRASSSPARSCSPTRRACTEADAAPLRARRRPRFAKTDPAHEDYDRVAGDDRAPEVPGRRDRARSRGRADLAT